MLTKTDVPTLEECEAIVSNEGNQFSGGANRVVFRKPGSRWVIKVDYTNGRHNQREYDNYIRIRPSLSNPSVRLPEMHMVGRYLVAEFIDGQQGENSCWGYWERATYRNGKPYYDKGCADKDCPEGDDCWANLIKDVAATISDLHSSNVKITHDGTVYIIDLGE